MAKLLKKQIKTIGLASVYYDVIKERDYGYRKDGAFWLDLPPDNWNKEQSELFDIMVELESKLKDEIFKQLNTNNK